VHAEAGKDPSVGEISADHDRQPWRASWPTRRVSVVKNLPGARPRTPRKFLVLLRGLLRAPLRRLGNVRQIRMGREAAEVDGPIDTSPASACARPVGGELIEQRAIAVSIWSGRHLHVRSADE
jgi:hypothetical protein